MGLFKRGPSRLERVQGAARLQEAMGRAEDAGPPLPFRLEGGIPVTAVTDAGQSVTGTVARVWQTFADSQTGAFRVLVAPAAEDRGGEERAAAS